MSSHSNDRFHDPAIAASARDEIEAEAFAEEPDRTIEVGNGEVGMVRAKDLIADLGFYPHLKPHIYN